MQLHAVVLAAMLMLAPLAARAADLVVWWEEGYNAAEDDAIRETIAAFEHKTSKQVELVQHSQDEMAAKTLAALAAGHPPDFLYGTSSDAFYSRWAYEGRLIDLADTLGSLAAEFDQDALARANTVDATTGRRGLHALPMGRVANQIHVWRSLLERAGFTLNDIPRDWDGFWSFWCDKVQPAVRKATGRDDIYGIGLSMSVGATDTEDGIRQFVAAYEADYVTRDGRLVIDEPRVRTGLVSALDAYTAIWRKDCTPPASVDWDGRGNNEAFLTEAVVMTVNSSLSIPDALRVRRPADYAHNTVTIGWPADALGQPLAIHTGFLLAVAFKNGGHEAEAKEFVHFLVGEGWLAHWLDFAGDRNLPPMPALLEAPFWLDPGDQHRVAAAMQFLTQPHDYSEAYAAVAGDWRHDRVYGEHVWGRAVHRVVVDSLTPEQAVDEAITRVKQLLSE